SSAELRQLPSFPTRRSSDLGPTVRLMQEVAKSHQMVIVVPIYEEEITGLYYNTAAVIDADGKYLGKYRKNHIPHVNPGFWEKFYRSEDRRVGQGGGAEGAGT